MSDNNPAIKKLLPDSRWSVIFGDRGAWRAGLYKPEFNSPDGIEVLEKHTCPELFVCLAGNMGIVIGQGAREAITILEPEQALLVTDYHNGFAVDPGGYFLVIERDSFETEYVDRKTGAFIRKVTVS